MFIFFSISELHVRVVVANSLELITISSIVGWLYFTAWSLSFYPQIIVNYRRKSVVGLSFDFVALNIVGYLLYGVFNLGLHSIPSIQVIISNWIVIRTISNVSFEMKTKNVWPLQTIFQDEYFRRFPQGMNPVQMNDIVFAFLAAFATFLTIIQCFIYEVSRICIYHFPGIWVNSSLFYYPSYAERWTANLKVRKSDFVDLFVLHCFKWSFKSN